MPSKIPSFLERLKARIARNRVVTASPDRVSELAAEVGKKIADERDLRAIQTRLLGEQRQLRRDLPIRRLVVKAQKLAHRARIRRPLSSAAVHQAFADHEGGIYLELSSGQSIRADKSHRSLHLRSLIHTHLSQDLQKSGISVREEVPVSPQ